MKKKKKGREMQTPTWVKLGKWILPTPPRKEGGLQTARGLMEEDRSVNITGICFDYPSNT